MVISKALQEDPMYDEDADIEEALISFLKGERGSAKLCQLAEAPAAPQEWVIYKYAYGLELELCMKARLAEEAVAEFSTRRSLPQGAGAASIKAAAPQKEIDPM